MKTVLSDGFRGRSGRGSSTIQYRILIHRRTFRRIDPAFYRDGFSRVSSIAQADRVLSGAFLGLPHALGHLEWKHYVRRKPGFNLRDATRFGDI